MEHKVQQWLPAFDIVPLFNAEECANIIAVAEAENLFKPMEVITMGGDQVINPHTCVSAVARFDPEHPIRKMMTSRVGTLIAEVNKRYKFELHPVMKDAIPSAGVIRYRAAEGGKFRVHRDVGAFDGPDQRKLSISIPLNDPASYQGGRLLVHHGDVMDATSAAGVGQGIVFPSFQFHEVSPMIQGTRYSAVLWVYGPRYR